MVFLPLSSVSLTELCSFWYGLKDLFTLHKLAGKIGQNFQNALLRMWPSNDRNIGRLSFLQVNEQYYSSKLLKKAH